MSDKVRPSAAVVRTINTYVDNVLTNFDSAPTLVLDRNESASGVTVTTINEATGQYKASWTNGAWTPGDRLRLKVSVGALNSVSQVGVIVWEGEIDELIDSRLAPTTAGRTIDIDANGYVERVVLCDTTTANSDMRGTDSAFLAASAPANFGDLAITATTGKVTVGTNDDKTGYALSTAGVTAVQSGLATAAAVQTAQNDLDILTGSDGAILATTQPNYAPAKAGDAMALTSGERTTLAAAIEAAIINELDGTAVMQAIADLIADDMTTGDLTVQAIASAVRDAILNRVLSGNHDTAGTPGKILQDVYADTNELQANQGNWVTATGFSTLDAAGIRTAVGLASANLDTQLGSISGVTDKLNTGLESDGLSGYQFTALALENGPGGGDATAANQTSILAAIDALENVSQAQVQAACTSALTTYDPPTRTEATADKAEILTAVGNVGGAVGSGADSVTLTILHEITGLPIADADVWISTDVNGSNVVAGTLQTNSSGEVAFMLDAGETYYCWRQKDGINFDNPQSFTAVAD